MGRELAPIKVPDMGLAQGMCVSVWFARPGDFVLEGDRLVEILAGDVVFDVTAPFSGKLVRIERDQSDPVQVDEILGWLEPMPDDVAPEEEGREDGDQQ